MCSPGQQDGLEGRHGVLSVSGRIGGGLLATLRSAELDSTGLGLRLRCALARAVSGGGEGVGGCEVGDVRCEVCGMWDAGRGGPMRLREARARGRGDGRMVWMVFMISELSRWREHTEKLLSTTLLIPLRCCVTAKLIKSPLCATLVIVTFVKYQVRCEAYPSASN